MNYFTGLFGSGFSGLGDCIAQWKCARNIKKNPKKIDPECNITLR